MAEREIEFRINQKSGEVKITPKGFAGESCMQATAPFEKLLGPAASDEKTEEYYAQEEAKQGQQIHEGGSA